MTLRPLTSAEAQVVRHICEHGWVEESVGLDRAKLLAQVDHLTAQPGCEVENCPCIDFAYKGRLVIEAEDDVPASDRATEVGRTTIVMDVKESPWQANLFVDGGLLAFLEFSSFAEEYPSRLPTVDQLF